VKFDESVPLETILPVAAHDECQGEHSEVLKHLESARNALLDGEAASVERALTALHALLSERLESKRDQDAA